MICVHHGKNQNGLTVGGLVLWLRFPCARGRCRAHCAGRPDSPPADGQAHPPPHPQPPTAGPSNKWPLPRAPPSCRKGFLGDSWDLTAALRIKASGAFSRMYSGRQHRCPHSGPQHRLPKGADPQPGSLEGNVCHFGLPHPEVTLLVGEARRWGQGCRPLSGKSRSAIAWAPPCPHGRPFPFLTVSCPGDTSQALWLFLTPKRNEACVTSLLSLKCTCPLFLSWLLWIRPSAEFQMQRGEGRG